jgi:3-hydroxyacyl-CoA dehydrogenase
VLPFDQDLKRECDLFLGLMKTDQRVALTHAFFAERRVAKLPEIDGIEPLCIETIGVVGGGAMGVGIAVSALLNGLDVTLLARDPQTVEVAFERISRILGQAVKRDKLLSGARACIFAHKFCTATDYATFARVDRVIEAVFESIEVKMDVLKKLDAVRRRGAILETDTSYLDFNIIAVITRRPRDEVWLHFFSPAYVMRLVEVVAGDAEAPDVMAAAFALAKNLKKITVRAGVCDGFVGNRILSHYGNSVYSMVLADASPYKVNKTLIELGLAMGRFAVSDLAELDIGWANHKGLAHIHRSHETYPECADRLCQMGWFERKTGRGFYIYDEMARSGRFDPEADNIIAAERIEKETIAYDIGAEEIVERYMAAMINEASRIVEEGIGLRPLDIDIPLLKGYGFPRWRGGPMQYADTLGLDTILGAIRHFQRKDPNFWRPAPLLARLVIKGRTVSSPNV